MSIIACSCIFVCAKSVSAATPSSAKKLPRGYVADIRTEREQVSENLVWVQQPAQDQDLRDRIFNQTLSREFRERYEQRFGQTEIERVFLAPNRTSYYNDAYGVKGTPQEISDERRRFGEFMMRRLAEWHVENYAKTDPSARAVWEAKERISNWIEVLKSEL